MARFARIQFYNNGVLLSNFDYLHIQFVSLYMYITTYCTSVFNICFKIGNLPSYCGIISLHMYPLIFPTMAQFCMKNTKMFLGEDPQILPSITILYFVYILIIKYILNMPFTYALYAQSGSLQKCKKKIT